MLEITINGKKIGKNQPIFLIGEVGVNHNGDLNIAKKLIEVAIEAKVDAIKFQTFKTKDLILENTNKVDYQKKSEKDQESFYQMLKKFEFSRKDFIEITKICKKNGIIFLSTPFDEKSVDLLEELGVMAYKVGSGDMNNFPLLKHISSKKKPILVSTGMSNIEEVKESVEFIKHNGVKEIVLFQCTTNYPTPIKDINLNVIETYQKLFPDLLFGFSDHSLGITASIGAAAKGVKVIEKHFTLDKTLDGPDHQASLDPDELKMWVKEIRNIELALGSYEKNPSKEELKISKIARKSIISAKELKKGDIITPNSITVKRPGEGISPRHFEEIIGYRLNKMIKKNSILHWEDIDKND